MINIPAAVTTAPREIDYLSDTLASLSSAGWPDPVIVAEPESPAHKYRNVRHTSKRHGPWGSFLRALRILLDEQPAADAYAFFQDDILISENCKAWLADQLWPADNVGALSLYTCERQDAGGDGWVCGVPSKEHKVYGLLAVVLPISVARLLTLNPLRPAERNRADVIFGEFCLREGLSWCRHEPSLVRHVGEVSARHTRNGEMAWTNARHEGRWRDRVRSAHT